MMLRMIAILFGIGFICIGVAGFLPSFYINGFLFGLFEVDFMHNMVHIISGVIAIMAATTYRTTRLYFQIFGVLYGLVAILGIVLKGDFGFIMMHMNTADHILHIGIAAVALFLGFYTKKIPT